jgi:phosphonopyruvate decarboxylase
MIDAADFFAGLDGQGLGPVFGVPCSFLQPLINYGISSPAHRYLAANNEGEAVAMAAGAHLAGQKPVVMFQNSGLGNAVNPFTSLTHPFRLPLLVITTLRGEPGIGDEPQHELMGKITTDLLRTTGIACAPFPEEKQEIEPCLRAAGSVMSRRGLPFALILKKGAVEPYPLEEPGQAEPPAFREGRVAPGEPAEQPAAASRAEAIALIAEALPAEAALLATTGHIGRELFFTRERPGNLYLVGSMGCAASVALGVALFCPRRPVVVLDGDGAALMRLEALVSVGHYHPPNLVHVILDNGMHESTGGQASLAGTVRFAPIAAACGYADAVSVASLPALSRELARCLAEEGPQLIHVRVRPGHDPKLGRPTLAPTEVKARFMAFLAG